MINIAHPRTSVKPPIKKVPPEKNVAIDDDTEKTRARSRCQVNAENRQSRKMSDHNRNLIEPESSMFDQLCDMINDLERSIANGGPLSVEQDLVETSLPSGKLHSDCLDEKFGSQLVPERDPPGNVETRGSSYNDILAFLETLEGDRLDELALADNLALDPLERDERMTGGGEATSALYRKSAYESDESKRNPIFDATREELTTARLQLEEKDATIRLLKEQLRAERKAACEKLESQKKAHATKAETREAQHRNVVKRHQKFIEQLIGEKRDLTEKCNSLAQRVREIELKSQRDLKVATDRHAVELQRARDLCAASEKIRRERWLQARTAKIKEMTVKGLEPEMRSIVEQHQREVQEIRAAHIKELQDAELRVVRRYNEQLEELRLELMASHEKTLAKEREIISNRYREKLAEQEAQFRERQDKLAEELAAERASFARERARRQAERDSALEETRLEYQKQTEMLKQRHESETSTLRETLRSEWLLSFENYKREQNEKFRKAEGAIRRESLKERDKAIELAIRRLERESRDVKAALQQNFDDTIRDLKDKYESDLKTANDLKDAQTNELSAKAARLKDVETRLRDTECKLKECSANLDSANEVVVRLTAEKNDAKNVARLEIESEKRELEEKVASLYREMAERNANVETSIAQLHARIKLIITQKMLTIKNLARELQDAKTRCEHLEQKLDQQRKEYILKCV